MGTKVDKSLTEEEQLLADELRQVNESDLVQRIPTREDLISSVRERARTPIVMGATSPLTSRRRKHPYEPRESKPVTKTRYGVQATIVGILLKAQARSEWRTLESILTELRPHFPQLLRYKLARTVYETARLGKLPNGKYMKVNWMKQSGDVYVQIIPESVPANIGKRVSAV